MEEFRFKLRGRTLVIIDWANVYGWFRKLKWEIDPKRLYDYLKSYPEIFDMRFYFGLEKGNEKSEEFHKYIQEIGYNLVSKEVKFVSFYIEEENYLKPFLKIIHDTLEEIDEFVYEDWEILAETGFVRKILKIPFLRRKCDFDVEITLDVMKMINNFDGLILFSGDGDYAYLVKELIKLRKQVILVFASGCKGKEYNSFTKGLFQCNVEKIKDFICK